MIAVGDVAENVELDEFLSRPLFAHLATASEDGPRDSPVWYLWEDGFLWIIGNTESDTFPGRVMRDPRCALGIVDHRPETGLLQHVGFRGTASVVPVEVDRAVRLIRRYVGETVAMQNLWFAAGIEDCHPASATTVFVKFTPQTIVVRDLSYSLDGRALRGAAVFASKSSSTPRGMT